MLQGMAEELTLTANIIDASEASPADYCRLLKPGVMMLVVFTGIAGMVLAPGHISPISALLGIICIALGSGAGATFNMWYDRDIDAVMKRTKKRPIPAGRILPDDALMLGFILSALSVGLLGLATNWMAAGLLAFAIFFYSYVYTVLLKRSTPQNIVIGGAAGALPPVIGWHAVSPDFAVEPWIYFLIIFLWTPPHFWALALYRHADYAEAKVPMLPVTNGLKSTRKHIFAYGIILVATTLLPYFYSPGIFYLVSALLLGGVFLYYCWRVFRDGFEIQAMALFKYSIFYLFFLFSSLILDKMIDFSLLSSTIAGVNH